MDFSPNGFKDKPGILTQENREVNVGMGAEKVVAIIDVETTGTNPEKDRVIEFAVQKGLEGSEYRQAWRVNPGIPIPPAASAVHGISDEDVKDKPPFSSLIPAIQKIFAGANVIVGYNVDFDLKCLASEFRRAGAKQLNISEKIIMDPLQIWRHFEPRKLEDALKRFVGEDHNEAHSAEGDVAATGKVLIGMLKAFGIQNLSWEEVQNVLQPDRPLWIGETNHIRWRDGEVIINFGKNSGKTLHELIEAKDSYLDWILGADFPAPVKEVITRAKSSPKEDFYSWATQKYPQP
jgi:DNA polymerase III subunit epsilon